MARWQDFALGVRTALRRDEMARAAGGVPLKERLGALLPEGSIRRRIASGAMWSILGSGVSQVLLLITTTGTARMLGVTAYGGLGIVLVTVNLFTLAATAGLGTAATKYVAEFRTIDPDRAGRVVGMSAATSMMTGIVVGVIFVAIAPWLARTTLSAPELTGVLRISAVIMTFSAVNGAQNGALAGMEAFRTIATANAIRGFASLGFVLIGAFAYGLPGAVWGYAAVSVVTFFVYEYLIVRECRARGIRISFRARPGEWSALLKFSLPAMLASMSFTPATWWSNALLVSHASFAENGIFSAARNWQTAILFFASAVSNLGLPMLSSVVADRDTTKYLRTMSANFALTLGLTVVVAIPVALLAPFIMSLYGPAFSGRYMVLVLVSIAAVLSAANLVVGHAIWSLGAARAGVVLALIRGAALVSLTYVFLDRGAEGLGLAWIGTAVVQTATGVPYMAWLLRHQASRWSVQRG